MTLFVKCPHCGSPVPWVEERTFRPFCSERCRLIDLGEWAAGSYALPGTPAEDQDEELPQADFRPPDA